MRIPAGVRRAFRLPMTSERIARELDDEVRFHVDKRADALEAVGMPREQAYAEALRRFGDVDDLREYCVDLETHNLRRADWSAHMQNIIQDLKFALRQFQRSPGFAVVAALTLMLGVGATAAIFSVVNGVVLQPLPFPHSDRIVLLSGLDTSGRPMRFADPTFDQIAQQNRSLGTVAEYSAWDMSVSHDGEASRVRGAMVSKQFFDVLQVKPILGRLFAPEEQQLNAPLAVVISYGMWMRDFAGSNKAIGAALTSGGTHGTIIGVLPQGKVFPSRVDVWLPRETIEKSTSYTSHNWNVLARVKDGVTLEQANLDVSSILKQLHNAVGDRTWTVDGRATLLQEQIVGQIKPLLMMLLGASAVLLLITCANVANLLIARMAAREGEIAVRVAIGAGRARIAQQLLIETSLLAAVGCLGGVILSVVSTRVLLTLQPAAIPRVTELHVDWRVVAFAALVSIVVALGLGLVTAWRGVRGDLRAALSQSQRTQAGGASYRVRGSLVVAQLAMTVVLLIGAGLLARSFVSLMTIDTGFRTKGLVDVNLGFDPGTPADRVARRSAYYDDLIARARAIPGVTSVAVSNSEPFSGGSSNGKYVVLDNPNVKLTFQDLEPLWRDKSRSGWATYRLVNPDYFKTLHIQILKGRVFTERDRANAPEVAVINAAMAQRQWPNQDPIGKVIDFGNIDGDLTPLTVVGVVGNTREEDLAKDPDPAVFLSFLQRPGNDGDVEVILATDAEGPTIAAARQAFRAMGADLSLRFQTVEDIIGRSVASQRFMLLLVGVFGAVALLLATLGVYSVISYLVAQRGREISIRVALGARAGDIVRLVLGQGVLLSVIGAAIGGVGAIWATRLLKKLLYQISPTDPASFAGVLVILCVVAMVASYVPARRASKLEPMDVLRGG